MTTLIAYTRGAIRYPGGRRNGAEGPSKLRSDGSQVIDPQAQEEVDRRRQEVGFDLLGWRSDRPDCLTPDRMSGIQQALFCVRADIADGIYVHRRSDLEPEFLAVVAAHLKVDDALLICEDDVIAGPEDCADGDIAELAATAAVAHALIDPRLEFTADGQIADEDLDIGLDGDIGVARLCDKLSLEFSWVQSKIAFVLDSAEYLHPRDSAWVTGPDDSPYPSWTPGTVDRRLDLAQECATRITFDAAWGAQARCVVPGLSRIVYAPAVETTEPRPNVVVETGTLRDGLPLGWIQALTLLRFVEIEEIEVPDTRVFASPVLRELMFAEAWSAGAKVICDGARVDPRSPDPAIQPLREVAGVTVRLHRALRVHDSATIIRDYDTLVKTELMRAKEERPDATKRFLAWELAKAAIPPPSKWGGWSHSQVLMREAGM